MTLLELAATTAIIGIVMTAAIPRFMGFRDRLAVDGAAASLTSALADTRQLAGRWNRRTALTVDTVTATAVVHANTDSLDVVPLGALFGVTLSATRDSIAYTPLGLGYGAANVTYVLRRGAVAETVTVSRAGRVRR